MPHTGSYTELVLTQGALLLRDEPFKLKSGGTSHVYANHRNLVCDPTSLVALSTWAADLCVATFGSRVSVCSVDSAAAPVLAAAVSLQRQIPMHLLRVVSREKGMKAELFSYTRNAALERDELPVVMLDDVVTTTATLIDGAEAVRQHGFEPIGAVCLLDRRTGSDLADSVLEIRALATLREVLETVIANQDTDNSQRRLAEIELLALSE